MRGHRTNAVTLLMTTGLALLIFGQAAFTRQPPPPDPRVAELVSRVIEAYGGETALRAVRGYHAIGRQWAAQGDVPIQVERWFGRPDRLRLELDYPDHHETRITAGALGWTGSSAQSLEPAIPVKLQSMRLQTARLDPPLRLLEQREQAAWRGTDPEGRAVLRIPIDTGLHIDYHVDPKTHHVTRMTMGMAGPPAMDFAADYDQFHEVDGVLVPFREITYAGGTVTSEFLVTRFEWNPKDLDSNLRPDTGDWD